MVYTENIICRMHLTRYVEYPNRVCDIDISLRGIPISITIIISSQETPQTQYLDSITDSISYSSGYSSDRNKILWSHRLRFLNILPQQQKKKMKMTEKQKKKKEICTKYVLLNPNDSPIGETPLIVKPYLHQEM